MDFDSVQHVLSKSLSASRSTDAHQLVRRGSSVDAPMSEMSRRRKDSAASAAIVERAVSWWPLNYVHGMTCDGPPKAQLALEAILEFLPFGGALSGLAGEHVAAEWRRARSRCVVLVERDTGLSREDITQRLVDHPRLLTLTGRVLWAAGMSGQDRVIRVLAGFLRDAVAEPSRSDEVMAFMPALEALSEHHIRILELAGTPAPDDDGTELGRHWNEDQLLRASGMRTELTLLAIRGLAAAGLVDDRRNDSITYDNLKNGELTSLVETTEIGQAVLEALRQVASS